MDVKVIIEDEMSERKPFVRGRRQPILGNRIRELRRVKGISLDKMAADLGVSKSALSVWETFQREISARDMVAIAAYLDSSILDVFFKEIPE